MNKKEHDILTRYGLLLADMAKLQKIHDIKQKMNETKKEKALRLLQESAGLYDQLMQEHKESHLAFHALYSEVSKNLWYLDEKIKREEARIKSLKD